MLNDSARILNASVSDRVRALCVTLSSASALTGEQTRSFRAILRTWLNAELHDEVKTCLGKLDDQRREALVMDSDGGQIAWRYLRLCDPAKIARRAVNVAAREVCDRSVPTGYNAIVAGLSELDDSISRYVIDALFNRTTTRAGRRVLFAVLARRDAGTAVVTDALTDPDAVVRRIARDGLDRRGTPAPSIVRIPNEFENARAQRVAVPRHLYQTVRDGLLDAAREAASERRRVDEAIAARGLPYVWVAAAWFDALRSWRWEPPFALYELALRQSLTSSADRASPWNLAEALCSLPPDGTGALRRCVTLLTLPKEIIDATAEILGEVISPENIGNPIEIYRWLAPRCRSDAPAFVRGLVDPDPELRRICASVTGRRLC